MSARSVPQLSDAMSHQDFSSTRTPLLYTTDAARPSSPFFPAPSPFVSPTVIGPSFPLSPPCHHTALTFSSHPSTFYQSYHSHPHHHSSWRCSIMQLTGRAIFTISVCLLLALLVLLTCHLLAPSHDSLFAVLSRMRPHFGHSSQLMPAAYAPGGAPPALGSPMHGWMPALSPMASVRMQAMPLGHAAAQGRTAGSITPGSGDASGSTDDERRLRQLGVLASYLSASEQRFTAPANSAASPGFLVTATRFWCRQESDLTHLSSFLDSASHYSDVILIGLNIEADRCSTADWLLRQGWGRSVHVVPVVPWLSVTGSLNALLLYASRLSFSRILYQSIEVTASVAAINSLLSHLDHHTLVVGACLAPYHSCPSSQPSGAATYAVISGVNNPWNTLAVWHIPSLLKTGFLMVSDSGREGGTEGQEEGPTIALLQWMARRWEDKTDLMALDRTATNTDQTQPPSRDAREDEVAAAMRCEAKLVTLRPDAVHWAAVEGSERQAYVERKLKSKRQRYEEQMERLGIEQGVVRFIVEEDSDKDARASKVAAAAVEAAASRRTIPIGH